MPQQQGLIGGFLAAAKVYPERPALQLGDQVYTYGRFAELAGQWASFLKRSGASSLTAIFAHRSLSAYGGVLASLLAGKGYVPLHPRFPLERTRFMMDRSEVNTLIVGVECLDMLPGLLEGRADLHVLGPEVESFGSLQERFPRIRFLARKAFEAQSPITGPDRIDGEHLAYLLFTSGSTGTPKGVGVSHNNVLAYLEAITTVSPLTKEDRCSQTFDLTFDLSVHDQFVTYHAGACLCPLSNEDLLFPAHFIRRQAITSWFSVPALAVMMGRMGVIRKAFLGSLRQSLFCGEALPRKTAQRWAQATPQATLHNLYGPTEATIAITAYAFNASDQANRAVVPIGKPFAKQSALLRDAESGKIVDNAGRGELLLSGSQITPGYFRDAEKTASNFIRLQERTAIWYRTGDLVERDEDGVLHFLGRLDHQVKMHGHRIELAEIEAVLRQSLDHDLAVALPWPIVDGAPDGIVGCLQGPDDDTLSERAREACRRKLPDYMVPSQIRVFERLPLNANGKIDRKKLALLLDDM